MDQFLQVVNIAHLWDWHITRNVTVMFLFEQILKNVRQSRMV